ncbi:MAG: hypothetical protein GY822_17970 [Deltaproteobacteria bacterium]|nr:hypothetical protein [Deltaproteobacteria bacterium]
MPDPCAGVTCSGQGACAVQADVAICICNDGFTPKGTDCISEQDPCAAINCSGFGVCVNSDGTPSCTCDTGYVPNGLTCIGADDPCAGQTCSDHGTCTSTADLVSCTCDTGFRPEGLACVEEVQLADGGTPGTQVPEEWTCNPSVYGDNVCDCGCGVVDSDCADATSEECVNNLCVEGQPKSNDNRRCVPNDWTCDGDYFDDGECDCGCGVKDFDCPVTNDLAVCEFELCDLTESPKPGTTYLCFPGDWTCNGDLYDEESGACDCGCGILDPDCDDATTASCENCGATGSCAEGSTCPGGIAPTDNATCDCTPTCDVCRTTAGDDGCSGECAVNCSGTRNGDVCEGGVDLIIGELSSTTIMVPAGSDLTLRYGYENRGGQTSGAFEYGFYLRAAGGGAETLMQTFTRLDVAPQEVAGPFSLQIPIDVDITPGSYEIRMVLDIQDAVTEDDETNNDQVLTFSVVQPELADLVVTALDLAATVVQPGGQLRVSYARTNEGGSPTGVFHDGFYLSQDAVITADDLVQGSELRSSLSPLQSAAFRNVPVTIGSNTPPGIYYFGYFLDVNDVVAEGDEANNLRSIQIVVEDAGLPDLRPIGFRVTTLTPVAPGDILGLQYSRTNQGTGTSGPFRFSVRISDNDVISASDLETSSAGVPGLAPAETVGPFSIGVEIPADLLGGYYFAGVLVDDTNLVAETNEYNNAASETFVVVPDTCDKYLQYYTTTAGYTDLFSTYRDDANCTKAKCDFRPCLTNGVYDDANSLGDFADSTHGDEFPSFIGAFPSDGSDTEDYWHMNVEDNFGATLTVDMSAFVQTDAGGIEMTVTYVCNSGGTEADVDKGDCISTTVNGASAVECLAAGTVGTTLNEVSFAPDCNGFDESGDVYVHVRQLTDTGCYPYVISGNF